MRILHVIASADAKSGGPIQGVKQLSSELSRAGHSIEVVSCDPPSLPRSTDNSLIVHALGPSRFGVYKYTRRLKAWLLLHAADYDIVVVNGIWQYHCIAARQACLRRHVPYLLFTHGMLDPWFNKRYPLKKLKKNLFWPWQYRVIRDANQVLFTAEEERRLAQTSFKPYRARERVVVYGAERPPVDIEAYGDVFLRNFPILKERRFLLFLGRVHPKKGCDLLIKAFRIICIEDPHLLLVIAGPAPADYQRVLESLAPEKAVASRIIWTGMLQGENKYGALQTCEVFVLPSHQENFGIAVAEALSCARPVLITYQVNIWREILDYKAGTSGN